MRYHPHTEHTPNRRSSHSRPPPKKPEAPVPRTYAALAAAATVNEIYVGRSGNLRSHVPNGRHRPRTLCVHSREGAIDVKALIGKLQEIALIPQQTGRLPNGDLQITFDSQRDKERFLGLCFVHVPRRQWAPGLADPPAIWVRAFGKLKELSLEVIRPVNLPEADNSDAAVTTFENPTDLDDSIPTGEEAPMLGTDEIGEALVEALNFCFSKGLLTESMRLAIISTLIQKRRH
eukprot:gene15929-7260_t